MRASVFFNPSENIGVRRVRLGLHSFISLSVYIGMPSPLIRYGLFSRCLRRFKKDPGNGRGGLERIRTDFVEILKKGQEPIWTKF